MTIEQLVTMSDIELIHRAAGFLSMIDGISVKIADSIARKMDAAEQDVIDAGTALGWDKRRIQYQALIARNVVVSEEYKFMIS